MLNFDRLRDRVELGLMVVMKRLFVIDNVFAFEECGVAVMGPYDDRANSRFYIGDEIEIRRLNGSTRRAVISGIPMGRIKIDSAEILLGSPITTADVGLGDEIWLLPKSSA